VTSSTHQAAGDRNDWLGSPRVVEIFSVRVFWPAQRQTMSVKVPPISTSMSTSAY
jgi:hypothetical protein